jgi:hypothetical protein
MIDKKNIVIQHGGGLFGLIIICLLLFCSIACCSWPIDLDKFDGGRFKGAKFRLWENLNPVNWFR